VGTEGDGSRDGTGSGSNDGSGVGDGSRLGDGLGFGDGRSLPVFALARSRNTALPPYSEPLRVIAHGDDSPEAQRVAEQVRTFLEMIVLGTTAQLAAWLRDSVHIGALRAIPSIGDLYERPSTNRSWGDGIAAWQQVLTNRETLPADVNRWLERLGANCQLRVRSQFESNSNDTKAIATRIHTLRLETSQRTSALPSELGAGISQVLPVIVAALRQKPGVLSIEQPELHVHPALQVGLGDLFIEAATMPKARRCLMIETHSEHIILRLLRRIRDTANGEGTGPKLLPEQLTVLHISNDGDQCVVRRFHVDRNGDFDRPWPNGFFEERTAEVF